MSYHHTFSTVKPVKRFESAEQDREKQNPTKSQSILWLHTMWHEYTYTSKCKSWAVHPLDLNTCMTVRRNEKPFFLLSMDPSVNFFWRWQPHYPHAQCLQAEESVNFHQPPTSTTDTIWALRFNPIPVNQPPEPHSAKYILLFPFQESLLPSQGFRTLLRVTSCFENRFFQMTWQTDQWGRQN